jgi:F420-non-reducing hydrogenase iron-sulfur subunit
MDDNKSADQLKVVCFSCKFSWGYLVDEATIAAKVKNWIPVICAGKIDSLQMMEAFRRGADGLLILACPQGDCHYQDGNCEARKKVHLVRKVLAAQGIEPERLQIETASDPDGTSIPNHVARMSAAIARLGAQKTGNN